MARTARDAMLEGVQAARRLHLSLGAQSHLAQGIGKIDVFRTAVDLGATLLFRPLDGPLGLYLDKPAPGILISTKRELHIQRFTGAHELGHLVLEHEPSVDTAVGLWRGGQQQDLKETAADAFASEFLLPRWLFVHHAQRHGWLSEHLKSPENAYQLSLRMCASYEATCWGLQSHNILASSDVRSLLSHPPKSIKNGALDGIPIDNPWANVWIITEQDNQLRIEGGPEDIFIFKLTEHSAAGYLWDQNHLAEQGMILLKDYRVSDANESTCGGKIERVLVMRASQPGEYQLSLNERRPWLRLGEPLSTVALQMALEGKEVGLPRFSRRELALA